MHGPPSRPTVWLTALALSAAIHLAILGVLAGRSPWAAIDRPARAVTISTAGAGVQVLRVDVLALPEGSSTGARPRPAAPPAPSPPRAATPPATASVTRHAPIDDLPPHEDEARPSEGDRLTAPEAAGPSAATEASPPTTGRAIPGESREPLSPSRAGTGGGGPEPSTPGGEGELELARLLHQQLARAAEHCYPSAARRFRQVGVVSVGFCVTESGGVRDVELRGSSGVALLDSAATGCVLSNALPLPARAAARCFEVPVRFGK